MLNNEEYKIGSVVSFKKPHPSKTEEWEIIRVGTDVKVRSLSVRGVVILMKRNDFNKKVEKVIKF